MVEVNNAEQIERVVKEARALVSMLETTSVRRICLEAGDFKIEIERAFGEGSALGAPSVAIAAGAGPSGGPAAPTTRHTQLAPLVGTFYRSANPGSKALVEVGSRVERGQTVGIIEAMKLMNEVLADAAGVVVEILVENAQPVQFEQPLLVIDTKA
jgi:acetyl-CoA carboxylase biotin carboxyl carrier protein